MDKIKAKSYLGLARKAGYMLIGSDSLDGYKQKLFVVLVDSCCGKSTQKIADRLQDRAPILRVDNLAELVSIPNCKIVAIKNKSLSESIIKNLTEN